MLTSILGACLSWHFAGGWVFDPAIVRPDSVEYSLKEGPHAGRHAIQRFYYQRVAPGVETTAWYEESGAVVRPGGTAVTTRYVADHESLATAGVTGVNFQLPMNISLLDRLAAAVVAGTIVAPPITRLSLNEVPTLLGKHGRAEGKTVITIEPGLPATVP